MFISDDIPSNYNRIAEISDNYIVLVRENKLTSGISYDAYLQFFNHSTSVLHLTNYKITTGDSYTYDYNYITNQYYSYIDYVSLSYSKDTIPLSDRSNSLFDRFDISNISIIVGLLLGLVILITSLASSLVKSGGIFSK